MARRCLMAILVIFLVNLSGCATTKTSVGHEEPKIILAVEIGSKGVKGKLFSAGSGLNSVYDIRELSVQRDINTNITMEYDETNNPYFKPEKIAETADAVVTIIRDMKQEFIISEDNIYIFGSSALINAKNIDVLFLTVAERTKKHVQFINVRDEIFYGYINNVPPDKQEKALLIDIGSGNTKMGYYDPRTKNARSMDISYGTKNFLDKFVLKKGKFLLQPGDVENIDRLFECLEGFTTNRSTGLPAVTAMRPDDIKNTVMESVSRQLSADTQADIIGYSSSAGKINRDNLLKNLLFDLNRTILTNEKFASSYYSTLFPSVIEKDFSEKNRHILDFLFPLQKYKPDTSVSSQAFDVSGRIAISEKLREKLEFNYDLKDRKPTYIVGGIAWAFITLTRPESVDEKIVSFTYDDVVRFKNDLESNPQELFSTKRLIDNGITSHAFSEINRIRQSVFTNDELRSGVRILMAVLEELALTRDTVYFVRDGGWYKGAILSKLDNSFFINKKISGSSEQNSMSGDTDEGVFEKDGRIYIKVKNRSLVSLIDEVAYKLRVNYTVLDDLSRYSISIFDNCDQNVDNKAFILANWGKVKSRSFAGMEELLDLLSKLKDSNGNPIRINYETIGDGIIFKSSKKMYKVLGSDLRSRFIGNLLDATGKAPAKIDVRTASYLRLREELSESGPTMKKLLDERKGVPFNGVTDPLSDKIAEALNLLMESGYFEAEEMRRGIAAMALPKNQLELCENALCKNYRILHDLFPNDLVRRDGAPANDIPNSYKKVFLNSITSKDAEEMLKKLYFAREKEFTLVTQPLPGLNVSLSNVALQPNSVIQPPPPVIPGARYESFEKARLANDTVIAIPSQNALIIKASRDLLSLMGDIIASIDAKYPQVLIETKVFEVDDSVSKKIGAALDYSKTNGATSYGIKTIFQEGLSSSALPLFFNQYTDAEKKLSLLTNLVINDQNGLVKILAEPRIVMKPGEEAAIGLNTVKYVSIQGVQTTDLKGVETGITFKITPIILSENKISLRLTIEQSEFIPTGESNVTLSTNKNTIYTTVIADDGELISIGGIDTKRYSNFSSGVPFLKDIPLLGAFFSSRTRDSNHAKIEFMIKPIIKKLNNYQKQNPIDLQNERNLIEKDETSNLKFFMQ